MTERLEIRVDGTEKAAYDQAAALARLDRSDWIRLTLHAAAKKALRSLALACGANNEGAGRSRRHRHYRVLRGQ